ncbi:MAG: leucine-rich repeat protein [Eubacteriales bacterium]
MKRTATYVAVLLIVLTVVLTLAACVERAGFRVSFITDGETYHTLHTNGGEAIQMPSDPQKDGYDFDGWFWDRGEGEQAFDENALLEEPLSANVSVYAKWKPMAASSLFTFLQTEDACVITGLTERGATQTTLDIPAEIEGLPVVNIVGFAFEGCRGITSVTIPDSVTFIGPGVFAGCSGITSATIPDSVAFIGAGVFAGCSGLTTLTLPFVGATPLPEEASSSTLLGYLFGADSYAGGVETTQWYSYYKGATGYIPAALERVTVTGGQILSGAFSNCSSLTTVTIGEGVTAIGEWAFAGCSALTTLTLPFVGASEARIPDDVTSGLFGYIFGRSIYDGGVKTIQQYGNGTTDKATYYLPASLQTVTITGGNIPSKAFVGCNGLVSVMLGNGVTYISSYAFYGCSALTFIEIGSGVKNIGSDAFYNCRELASVTILDGVLSISARAFYACRKLTSIEIPDSVSYIGERAFYACSGLTSITVSEGNTKYHSSGNCLIKTKTKELLRGSNGSIIPSDGSVTSIAEGAFSGCSGLTSLTLPDSLKTIASYAFWGCSGLISLTLPNSATFIGEAAFSGCNGLTSVLIGDGVKFIGPYAFSACAATILWGENPSITTIGQAAFRNYQGTSLTIPESVTKIDFEAFYQCTKLTSVVIGNGVTSIGDRAFRYCTSLTSVIIPDSVITIGPWAFYGCGELTTLVIGDSVTTIDVKAFEGCAKLTSLTIPDSVTAIGEGAFLSCGELTTLVIGGGLTSISKQAFAFCSALTSINIPASVTTIGEGAFLGCGVLTSISVNEGNTVYHSSGNCLIETATQVLIRGCQNSIIPDDGSVTSIGPSAFAGSGLLAISIPEGVTSIGSGAFYDCRGLSTVVLPEGVTTIGSTAFSLCSGLTSITLPEGLTFIGADAFSGCSALSAIVFPESLTTIDSRAFSDCSALTTVTIPGGVTLVGEQAFFACSSLTGVTFVNTSGWYLTRYLTYTSGTSVDVTNPAENAIRLKQDRFYTEHWKRNP